jgi:hypothetical protein
LAFLVYSSCSRNTTSGRLGSSLVNFLLAKRRNILILPIGHSLETFPEEMKAVRDAGHEL